MENDDDVITGLLGRIAEALNVPIEDFFAADPQSEAIAGADECLRLWMQIGTAEVSSDTRNRTLSDTRTWTPPVTLMR